MRFHLALWTAKLCSRLIRLVAKDRGTNLPGELALKLDPEFIAHIRGIDPEKTLLVTGTNGKSTSTNLIHHVLTHAGRTVTSNLKGSNMLTGVASALLRDCTMGGRLKCEYVVLETDERYLKSIRAQLPGKYICLTNIQKDQAQRNGEPSFIRGKIAQVLDDSVTLITNQDDPNAYFLRDLAGRTVTYGVSETPHSFTKRDDFFSVSMPCPRCHNPIVFHRYNLDNIGPFHCPSCGFGEEQKPDYLAENVDFDRKCFTLDSMEFSMNFGTSYFLYCYVLAIAVAEELGLGRAEIAAALRDFHDVRGRLVKQPLAGKTIQYVKMKEENSETLQSSLNLVASDHREKVFFIGYDEFQDYYPPYTNSFYLFDCDFRALRRSGVSKWVCMSTALARNGALRFLYDGFSEEDMVILPDSEKETLSRMLRQIPGDNVYLVQELPYWKE